jgi:arylsulfatase A-like enzyme
MHIELFDPHEPWDPPAQWARLYDPNYDSMDGVVAPMDRSGISEQTFQNIKHAYAGEVSMVDHWVGHLLGVLEETGHALDTLVVFTSDHGCIMGEMDEIHKLASRIRNQVTQTPMIMRHPKRNDAGTRVKGFCQHPDIMPTILEAVGAPIPDRVNGRSLWAQVDGDLSGAPETIVSGFGPYAAVRNHKWNYIHPWDPYAPELYKHLPAEHVHQLFDLENDPEELTDVLADHPKVAQELTAFLADYMAKWAPQTVGTIQGTGSTARALTADTRPQA